jgi:hypothetical protein
MKKPKRKSAPAAGPVFLERVVVPVPVQEAAVVVQPSRICPVCRQRKVGGTKVDVGPVSLYVCDPCAEPYITGLRFLEALKRFL